MYSVVCTVVADVRSAVAALPPLTGENGDRFFRFDYDIELLFGLTEPKALICWDEKVSHFPRDKEKI
jgi:hypothetical protein